MADILKDIYDKSKRQQKVIFQKKKPLLNYELNLAQDILKNQSLDLIKQGFSNNYSGESLKVEQGLLSNEVFVRKGIFFHKGFPIDFTDDKRISVPVPPGTGSREDVLYVEWYLNQLDTPADPTIGYVTSEQSQLVSEISVSEGAYPTPTDETITFDAGTKTITLTNGFFPDWLRIEDTKFVTNSTSNPGMFTVVSSSDNKNITVSETVVDETSDNVNFKEYSMSGDIPKEFLAYRRNILILAKFTRTPGNNDVTDITDLRDASVYNYILTGCKIEEVSGLDVSVSEGELYVGDINHFVEASTPDLTLTDNAFNYVYVDWSGEVVNSTTEPTEFHVMLAEVRTSGGSIVEIEDKRIFQPIAWSNKYGSEGSGETGYPAATQEFTAGETLVAYTAVYVSGANTVSKANASSLNTVPMIGITPQTIVVGQKDNVVTHGKIQNTSWTWTPGEDVFLDASAGGLTDAAGVTGFGNGCYVHRIGIALSATELFVNPDLVYIKKDISAEMPLIVLRENGQLEVMAFTDKLDPDRLSFFAPLEIPTTTTFQILPGRYAINEKDDIYFPGVVVNLSTGGNYETTAITSSYYNKASFTLDDTGTLNMYEGDPEPSLPVEDPVIPANELLICTVTFQDNAVGGAGTVLNIEQNDIEDKRSWLDVGSTDPNAFKAIYRNRTSFLVQKGEMWINEGYISLASTVVAPGAVTAGTHYVYLDMTQVTGSGMNMVADSSCFITSMTVPTALDRRTYIPLATYDATGAEISRSTFKTYSSKFWQFRDALWSEDQTFEASLSASSKTIYDTTVPDEGDAFQFSDTDFLKITVNGLEVYETDDYTKSAPNTVTFLSAVKKGAKVKIRKV